MSTTATPDSLFELLSRETRKLPPVEKWNPEHTGDSRMRIASDGRWFYQGSEIQRPEMVKLFSTILRREGDQHFLVTPVEKLEIEVEDAPFIATDLETRGKGEAQEILFITNVQDLVMADADHPLRVETPDTAPKPYLHVRAGLEALISRPLYYRLVDLGVEQQRDGRKVLGVWSAGEFFELGNLSA
jgi:uncharacterized protein